MSFCDRFAVGRNCCEPDIVFWHFGHLSNTYGPSAQHAYYRRRLMWANEPTPTILEGTWNTPADHVEVDVNYRDDFLYVPDGGVKLNRYVMGTPPTLDVEIGTDIFEGPDAYYTGPNDFIRYRLNGVDAVHKTDSLYLMGLRETKGVPGDDAYQIIIKKCDLSGAGLSTIFTKTSDFITLEYPATAPSPPPGNVLGPGGLVVDHVNNRIFYTDNFWLYRIDEPTGVETPIEQINGGLWEPTALRRCVKDYVNNKLYYTFLDHHLPPPIITEVKAFDLSTGVISQIRYNCAGLSFSHKDNRAVYYSAVDDPNPSDLGSRQIPWAFWRYEMASNDSGLYLLPSPIIGGGLEHTGDQHTAT